MAERDDLGLSMDDLADIFGLADDKAAKAEPVLGDVLEDLFFGEDKAPPPSGPSSELSLSPQEVAAPPAAPAPPPKSGGAMSEEEYAAFRAEVIARHERRKAEEEAQAAATLKAAQERATQEAEAKQAEDAARKAQEEYEQRRREIVARYEAQKAELEAQEKAQREREGDADRKAALLEKYKQAKLAAIAGVKPAGEAAPEPAAPPAPPAPAAEEAVDAEKEARFREFLKSQRAKAPAAPGPGAPGKGLPKLAGLAGAAAAAHGLSLDLQACLALAALYEETREALAKRVSDRIGAKATRTMMMKTLEKACGVHGRIFNRGGRDPKGQVRPDGSIDQDLLARSFYAIPEAERQGVIAQALHDLLEVRFIAIEMVLGVGPKGAIVSQTLAALEDYASRKRLPEALRHWYFEEVVPSSVLQDGE